MTAVADRLSIAFQTNKDLAQYAELGARVEHYGFGTVSVYSDLMFQPPLTALIAIAAATQRVRLGPACLNPFTLHPVEIAGQIAVLDAASNGRAYLGLARGAWLDSLGLTPARPVTAIRETIAVVRHLLGAEQGAFEGELFRLQQNQRLQYPVVRADVPIMIGTWSPRLAALAGELAAEVKVGGSANPDMVAVMQGWISDGARRAGRTRHEIGIALGAVTVVDEDGERARSMARVEVARYLPVVAALDTTKPVDPELLARIAGAVSRDDFTAASACISDELLERFAFAGTPTDIVARVETILAAGATRIEFGTPHGLTARSGIDLLGKRVLPHFCG